MNQLSKAYLSGKPEAELLSLPEKVLQFGTGILLRSLPDYFIDKANRQGIFNGRVVVVKSTDKGDTSAFEQQDNLYTLCIRGFEKGQTVSENIISTAISRTLSANSQWSEILNFASNPALEMVISNTTEVGIQLVREDIRQTPPASFPGKLLAFLLARYQAFQGDRSKGLVIVPTELVPGNGALLESIVFELAHLNNLDYEFLEWLENACTFCNSLVDRIVPGSPVPEVKKSLEQELGYADQLITMAEPYGLWAIEGDEKIAQILSFQNANSDGVVVAPEIGRFRELKLRLLNGTHSLSCGVAILAGYETVSKAMGDASMARFIERLMLHELAPAVPYDLPAGEAVQFGRQVLDRFRNPFIEHQWQSIAVQYSAKIRLRNVPVLLEHYKTSDTPPVFFALGFAAFLCYYRNPNYRIQDDQAAYFISCWEKQTPAGFCTEVLSNIELWGVNLCILSGFKDMVISFVTEILEKGASKTMLELVNKHEAKNTANTSV